MMRQHPAMRGFTLVEVVIAMLVVALLAALALPSFQEQLRKGRRAEAKTALMKTIQLQERNYTASGTYRTDLGALYGIAGDTVRSGEDPTDVNSWYVISADTVDCGTTDLQVCVRVVATPRAGYVDTNCGVLTLNNRGVQTESGTRDRTYCWR